MDSHSVSDPKIPVRNTDLLLAIFFGAMIFLADEPAQRLPLIGLGIIQLFESRLPFLSQTIGRVVSVTLQLLLAFELMHESGGVASPYFPILLLPLVSTATYLGVIATVVASMAAVGALLSPLLFVDWSNIEMDPEGWHVLVIRGLLMAIIAVLVNMLGKAIRTESARYKATAEQLAAAEAAVRRAERLAALGQLTAGLAHELRNPLASIKGSADLLARRSATDPMSRELGEIISSEVDRTNLLVTRFLSFARPLEPQREMTDVTTIIDRAAGHANVEIVRDYAPDVPPLALDPALMEQVFINLLSNAAQASEPGVPVTVSTRRTAQRIEIDVIDRGSGIPADKIETIFNPFFTTKQTGVGLGLAIVSKIVNGHGGKMTVDSEPGKGSTFRVCLPLESVSNLP
ncbi:MAG TPA: ATP-binding protein [Bryobacteraceae bacterium]|jgi:signal transduction histidine kinase